MHRGAASAIIPVSARRRRRPPEPRHGLCALYATRFPMRPFSPPSSPAATVRGLGSLARSPRLRRAAVCAALALCACSPRYDWRTIQSGDGAYAALYPGKPSNAARDVTIAGRKLPMTMEAARVREFRAAINDRADLLLGPEELMPRLRIDSDLGFRGITSQVASEIAALAPFGAGNPRPVFAARRSSVSGCGKVKQLSSRRPSSSSKLEPMRPASGRSRSARRSSASAPGRTSVSLLSSR